MNDNLEVDIKVPNQTRYLSLIGKIGEDIARTLKRYRGDREELAYQINLVLTEATSNAILHAVSDRANQLIHINIAIINQNLHIKVFDQGQGFDPKALPNPHTHVQASRQALAHSQGPATRAFGKGNGFLAAAWAGDIIASVGSTAVTPHS